MPSRARYELIPKLLASEVDPGQSIEVDIYVTGAGPIGANKLLIVFPTAITDEENPGEATTSVKAGIDLATGRLLPAVGKNNLQTVKCHRAGLTIGLSPL